MYEVSLSRVGALKLVALLFQASITAAALSKIRVYPTATSFNPGDNVTLNCSVIQGGPADVIFWYKDEQPINYYRESNASQWAVVSLIDVSHDKDDGVYRCIVKKGAQLDTDVFELHVNGAPEINLLPKHRRAFDGEDILLPCKAKGWPVPSLYWTKNGKQIIDEGDGQYDLFKSTGELTLMIRSATKKQEGNYSCVAVNEFGKDRQNVKFTVFGRRTAVAPVIKVETHYVIADEGSNVTLNCLLFHVDRHLSAWNWKLNGHTIEPDMKRYKQRTAFSDESITLFLSILNISQQDSGTYECEVATPNGYDKSNITLIVDDKENFQNISTKRKIIQTVVNAEVKLECLATYPMFIAAEKWWIFNGRRLKQTSPRHEILDYKSDLMGNLRVDKLSLLINNATEEDFGNYSCVINSPLGSSMETILLVGRGTVNDITPSGKSNSSVLLILLPFLSLGLLISIIGYLIYRRIRGRGIRASLRRSKAEKRDKKVNDSAFQYDVFLTFSTQDRQWVDGKLMPLLESHQMKCCIHSRDFELGRAFVDNMAESVYSSRKVIAVMSGNYTNSKFCLEELNMALHRNEIFRDCSLLIIRIDGVHHNKLPKALGKCTALDVQEGKDQSNFEKKLMRFLVGSDKNAKLDNT